jgi:hypothetical protein
VAARSRDTVKKKKPRLAGLKVIPMKRMKYLLGMIMIAAILFAQSGCMMVAGHAALP